VIVEMAYPRVLVCLQKIQKVEPALRILIHFTNS